MDEKHITFDDRKKNALDLTMGGGGGGGGGWGVGGWGVGWWCNQLKLWGLGSTPLLRIK